jgi:hypothetical protein
LVPWRGTLSQPEYIPTRLMQFFQTLYEHFPNHKLVSSDFHKLADAVEGLNAPVVQTRYKRQMIPVTTPLVSLSILPRQKTTADKDDRFTKATSISSSPLTLRSWNLCILPSLVASRAHTCTRTSWPAGQTLRKQARRTETIRY